MKDYIQQVKGADRGSFFDLGRTRGYSPRMSVIGLNLRRLRHAKGWTQEQLARKGGWSRVYIARIETGAVRSPTAGTLQKLAELLGVSVDSLVAPEAGESPIEPLLERFLASPLAEAMQPTEEELDWLRSLDSVFWLDLPPSEVTIVHLLKAKRGTL